MMKAFILVILTMTSFSPLCLAEDGVASGEQQFASNEATSTATSVNLLQECAHLHAVRVMSDPAQGIRGTKEKLVNYAYNQIWNICIDKDRLGDGLRNETLTKIINTAVEKARREVVTPRAT